MKKISRQFFCAAVAVFAAAPLFAVPPAPGIKAPKGATCHVNTQEFDRRVKKWQAMKAAGAPVATIGVRPTTMTPKIIVIRVDFPDMAMTKLRTETIGFFNQVHDFYMENSYNLFNASFTVSQNTYRLTGNMSTYGADCSGDVACKDQTMFNEAITLAVNDGVNFAPYDHIMVYHAGEGQETVPSSTSNSSDYIWSVYLPTTETVSGKSFAGFTVVPETESSGFSPLGVICHEYGHQQGLPDLYDVSVAGGRSTVGTYDLMDYPYTGTTAADGSNPPHFSAWSKKFLGFNTETVQSSSSAINLNPAETSKTSFIHIPIPGASASEYFLLEYRSKSAGTYDRGIPMSGMAVWHIDDDIALNSTVFSDNVVNSPSLSGRGHRGVDLVEADGTEANPAANDLGNGNLFVNGQTFTYPQSNAFSGVASGVTVGGISGVGGGATSASLVFITVDSAFKIAKVINYPNPAGDPSKYPVRTGAPAGTLTTLMLQLSQPVTTDKISLDLYTVNGERVRSFAGSDIALKLGSGEPTTNDKWVYECDWDGKTDGGNAAAPGVYFYRFKVNGKVETGKLVLIR